METTSSQAITPAAGPGRGPRDRLGLRRGVVIAVAVTAAATALALGQHWFLVANLPPLLFILPCFVMMLMCMKGMSRGQRTDTPQTPARIEAPTTTQN
jgi:hypothetical protein